VREMFQRIVSGGESARRTSFPAPIPLSSRK
jgi:hypothetical protein